MKWLVLAGSLLACVIGLVVAPEEVTRAWLVAVSGGLGLSLGAMAIAMIHVLTGGRWGEAIRPQLEALAGLLPWMMIGFLPLLLAVPMLMPFVTAAPERLPAEVLAKRGYLEPLWLGLRTVAIFALWLVAARPLLRRRIPAQWQAVLALVSYLLGLLVFTADWMLALDPRYVSTIYAPMVASAQMSGALALATLLARDVSRHADLAKLLLAAALNWTYMAFMQWLVTFMGDLPNEAAWYLERTGPLWTILLVGMALCFAVVPFLALLASDNRNAPRRVRTIAALMVAGYALEATWRVGGAFARSTFYLAALAATFLLVGAALFGVPQILRQRVGEAPHG